MKQKIVIKVVQMTSEKCRTKAMKIAVTSSGVTSVAIQGSDKDQLVVIGEDVDSACLTCSLKKKFCYVTILTVEEIKPEEKPKPKPKPEPTEPTVCHCVWSSPPPPPPHPMYCKVVCQDENPNSCLTM